MARPYLGESYGNTDRRTPGRLLGGIPEAASQAPIGTGQLQQPAIQAVQQLVETFSPAGQGATLGGPAQVPTPPQLPQAQSPVISPLPRPVQAPNPVVQQSVVQAPSYAPYVDNITPLARSLAGFSTFFEKLTDYGVEQEKQADARAQQQGMALAQEAGQVGAFQSLQELQKRLEKGVAEGAVGYEDMLRRFQAADPRALRYATINLQTAYIDGNVATLKERLLQTKTLLDGRPLESVPASDPEFQRAMTALMFPQGTAHIMPEVWKSRQQQIQATYGSAMADQESRFGGFKTQKAKQSLTAVIDSAGEEIVSGTVPPEQVASKLSLGLNGFFLDSGQTTEEYQKEKQGLVKQLVGATLMASGGNWGRAKVALSRLPEVMAQVTAGPNGELLLDQIGGKAALLEVVQEAQKQVIEQQNLQDGLEQREAREQLQVDLQQMLTPEVLGDPVAVDQTEELMLRRGRELYGSNPEMAAQYEEGVRKHFSGIRAGFVVPTQEKNEVALWAEMAQNPNVDFTDRIMQLQQSGQLSYQAAKGFLQAQSSRNREDNKANYQVLRGLQDDLKKRLEAQFARGNSEGGANLTPNEAKQLWEAMGQLYRQGDEMIRKAPGQDMTTQLGGLYSNALQQSLPQQTPQAPAGATPESINKGLVPGGRGNAQQNAQLRRKAETQPLYSKERMIQQLDGVLTGKPLDDATRNIIRRTGMKPSEFFQRQMQLHGIPVDSDAQKRLQELDGGDLVSRGPAARPNPYLASAIRLRDQIATGLLNVVAPPAYAARRDSTPFSGSASMGQISGSRVAVRSVPPQTRALLRTIRFAEGTAHSDGYRTMFTGAKFSDLSRHPRRINRSNGLASDAAGAYQFLSTTWDSVGGGAMTPERQDMAAIRLVRNRGVDPRLPSGFTRQVADRLAPEWASFPTMRTGTSYYGQGGKSYAELKAYYDQVLREEMARGR
jgi:lysozyme